MTKFAHRAMVRSILLASLVGAGTALAQSETSVDVFKTASCGYCAKWIEHLQRNGFQVIAHNVNDVPTTRTRLGISDRLAACHTARVGYVIEGHVPAADIQRLLKGKPTALGLPVV